MKAMEQLTLRARAILHESILYGVYSTEQLAREAAEELLELGNIHHYEIECPKLDEFGWR